MCIYEVCISLPLSLLNAAFMCVFYCLAANQISLGTINVEFRMMLSKEPNRIDSSLQAILDINIVLSELLDCY